MRVVGIVLLVLAALLIVPALTLLAYLAISDLDDPHFLMTLAALLVAGLGACVGSIGGAAVYVGGRKR